MIDACTDIETDAAENELNAPSPWPPQIREQVWGDRVRLRLKMKQQMKTYGTFLNQYTIDEVRNFCIMSENALMLKKIFQMPRALIMEEIKEYGIHSSYSNVLSAVIDQVANIHQTKYEPDGRSIEELQFEKELIFSKRGAGFTLNLFSTTNHNQVNSGTFNIFLNFVVKLGGPKLLMRKLEQANDDDADDDAEDDESNKGSTSTNNGPSFQGDRRLIRLIIARYWARGIMKKYEDYMKTCREVDNDVVEVAKGIAQIL